jgi:hypothetical protein
MIPGDWAQRSSEAFARLTRAAARRSSILTALVAIVVLGATTSSAMIVKESGSLELTPASCARAVKGALTPPKSSRTAQPGRGIPFGPPKLPREAFGDVFTATKLALAPDSIVSTLTTARANATRVFIILVGPQKYYRNSDGTFNLDLWKSRVNRFRGIDFREFVRDGTIIAHQLVSEAKARNQWGGKVIPNHVLDEMARFSEDLWPAMATVLRTDPSDLEAHAAGYLDSWPCWRWRHLDAASARYLTRKGDVERFAADQQASADRQHLALVVGLNAFSGGDGSSKIPSPAAGKWAMSADELRSYGTQLVRLTRACAFELWRYETPGSAFEDFYYFRRPDITAATVELAALAARRPARSCGT